MRLVRESWAEEPEDAAASISLGGHFKWQGTIRALSPTPLM
jgi:hypothetical protein